MTLLECVDKHRGAFDYDWRTRFHLPFDSVPAEMDWAEAWRLFNVLLSDPSSHVAAAFGNWDHPISREDIVLRDLYDLQHRSKSKRKPNPYPRPWIKAVARMGSSMPLGKFRQLKERLAGRG